MIFHEKISISMAFGLGKHISLIKNKILKNYFRKINVNKCTQPHHNISMIIMK